MNQKNETDHRAYAYAVMEQADQHIAGLDELSAKIQPGSTIETGAITQLTFNERSAVERSLQVLAEIAIGCSKHWLRQHQKPVPAESRACIERVYECLSGKALPDIQVMRGAIATRNVIVHDYLNLDWQRIEPVLKQRKYVQIREYIQQLCQALLKTSTLPEDDV